MGWVGAAMGWGSPVRGAGSQGGSREKDPRLRALLGTRTGWSRSALREDKSLRCWKGEAGIREGGEG